MDLDYNLLIQKDMRLPGVAYRLLVACIIFVYKQFQIGVAEKA